MPALFGVILTRLKIKLFVCKGFEAGLEKCGPESQSLVFFFFSPASVGISLLVFI